MKKILFMCGMYHPNYSANGVCVKNLVDEFIKSGYDVTCICNDYGDYTKNDVQDDCKIYRVRRRFLQRLEDYCLKRNNVHLLKIVSLLKKIQLLLNSWRWPIISKLYTYRFYYMAKKLYLLNKYDVVVSVYCPIDSLYAGYLLKKKFPDVYFVPYYLDALAGGWGPKTWSKTKTDNRLRKYEKKIDSLADLIISMQSSKKYHDRYEISDFNKKRFYLDVPLLRKQELKEKNSNFKNYGLFAGNLSSPHRNVKFILEFFLIYCNKYNVNFYLIGDANPNSNFKKYEKASKGKIKYLGKKDRDVVSTLESNASFLVNIGSSNSNTVPGKIFEYFSFNKPIISSFSNCDEPSICYLKEYGKYFLLNENNEITDSIIDGVNHFLNSSSNNDVSDVYEKFYNNTPTAFVELIENKGELNNEKRMS